MHHGGLPEPTVRKWDPNSPGPQPHQDPNPTGTPTSPGPQPHRDPLPLPSSGGDVPPWDETTLCSSPPPCAAPAFLLQPNRVGDFFFPPNPLFFPESGCRWGEAEEKQQEAQSSARLCSHGPWRNPPTLSPPGQLRRGAGRGLVGSQRSAFPRLGPSRGGREPAGSGPVPGTQRRGRSVRTREREDCKQETCPADKNIVTQLPGGETELRV